MKIKKESFTGFFHTLCLNLGRRTVRMRLGIVSSAKLDLASYLFGCSSPFRSVVWTHKHLNIWVSLNWLTTCNLSHIIFFCFQQSEQWGILYSMADLLFHKPAVEFVNINVNRKTKHKQWSHPQDLWEIFLEFYSQACLFRWLLSGTDYISCLLTVFLVL